MSCNQENVRKWVDALRSGDFEQRTGRLNAEGQYCCLGVACELALGDGVKVVKTLVEPSPYADHYAYDGKATFLPTSVQEWLGIIAEDPSVLFTDPESETEVTWGLVGINDGLGASFDQIADALERTYLKPAEVPA